VTYDPDVVSYGELLHVFFSVAHNPTQLNYQGPDRGPQYRSAIFPMDDEQRQVAEAYIDQLEAADLFEGPIVTTIEQVDAFYPAEAYHQDYLALHPDQPYIAITTSEDRGAGAALPGRLPRRAGARGRELSQGAKRAAETSRVAR
jgi:peptide-methionine (S)-S-oxide reductase